MGPFGSNIKVECFVDSGIPVLNGSNLTGFALNDNSFRYVTPEKADSLGKANAYRGDIVITHRGTLGQIVFIPKNSKHSRYVISQSQFRVKCNEKILPEYLVYYFHTNAGQHKLLSNASQVGVPALARASTTFQTLEIDIPDVTEQRKIVDLLETIREKIELNNAINNNLEQQAALLFDKNYSNNNYNISTLEAVATIKYGKGLPTKKLTAQGFPVFGGNGVIGRYTHFMYEEPQVLVSCRGAASGKIMESYPNSFVTNNSLILEWNDYRYYEFYKQFLLANPLNSYATGSAQPQITIDNIKNVPIPYPNYDEISELCLTLKSISSLHYENVIENNKLANLRDTLLPHLMSGELDVSDIEI